MSLSIGVRALGNPYLGFRQEMVGGMVASIVGPGTVASFGVDFALHRAVQRVASDTELHPLLSVFDSFNGSPIVEIAITPTHAIKLVAFGTAVATSFVGQVFPDGVRRSLAVAYSSLASTCAITLDGALIATGAPTLPLTPAGSHFGQVALLNGVAGLSAFDATLYRASMNFGLGLIEWAVKEKSGPRLTAPSFSSQLDATLLAAPFYPPNGVLAYPSFPTSVAEGYYRWVVRTPFTRVNRTRTKYARVAS